LSIFGIQDFLLFLVAGLLFNVTPEPVTAFILGRTLSAGRRAGIASALGVGAGCACHTCAAAVGLSAFLATSAWAFSAVKLLGAAYLVYLGVRMLLEKSRTFPVSNAGAAVNFKAAFWQGLLTNVLNPKVALFFLAFLPQFIDPAASTKVPAFLLLGFTFVVTGTIWCIILVWFAGAISNRLRRDERFSTWLQRVVGGIFVALGIRLAAAR